MARRLVLVLLTCMALSTVAGCSDEDAPSDQTPGHTSSSTAEPSKSPSTEAAQTPVQVVRAWYRALNQLIEDGDASAARALATNDCTTCENEIRPIEETFQNGGSYRLDGPGWDVKRAKLTKRGKAKATVVAAYVGAAGELIASKGAKPTRFEELRTIVEITLTKLPGGWRVSDVVHVE